MNDVLTIVLTVTVTCIVSRGVNYLFDSLRDNRSTHTKKRRRR